MQNNLNQLSRFKKFVVNFKISKRQIEKLMIQFPFYASIDNHRLFIQLAVHSWFSSIISEKHCPNIILIVGTFAPCKQDRHTGVTT